MTTRAFNKQRYQSNLKQNTMDKFGRDLSLRTDEFGRDPTLRRSKAEIEYERSAKVFRQQFLGKSWLEIEWTAEEEEEQKVNKTLKELDLKRKKLWNCQAYDLEDGEVFE